MRCAKTAALIFAGSEIYGGLANTWDYGPLGVEFKNNVKKAWWQKFVQESKYNVGIDCAILMNREVWVASRPRRRLQRPADGLQGVQGALPCRQADRGLASQRRRKPSDGWTNEELEKYIAEHDIVCPNCGKKDFTGIRQFNLMFKTHAGRNGGREQRDLSASRDGAGHLRQLPERHAHHAQASCPFGVSRRSASPSATRSRPATSSSASANLSRWSWNSSASPATDLEWFDYWRDYCHEWLLALGIKEEHLRLRDHEPEELAFYSKATTDFEYLFPFGWGELWGVADRTDYDLKAASDDHSGKTHGIPRPGDERDATFPTVIEPSLGADRVALAFLCDAYEEQELEGGDVRVVLHLHPALAPYKCAVLPLQKNKLRREGRAKSTQMLAKHFMVDYDETGSIGKRYRRQDEIGTPFCDHASTSTRWSDRRRSPFATATPCCRSAWR